jgi:uncharacterized protein (DUF1697 family)
MTAAALHAAFLRNVNLGRPGSPTRAQLEAAFLEAGAASAASFLVNGTLVFAAPPGVRPRAIARRACEAMRASCAMREPVFVRSVAALAALVAERPFDGVALGEGDAHCVTFLAGTKHALPALPFANARGDVELLVDTGAEILSASRLLGASPGSPNALLERLLGAPATTRNWRTVVRLVDKFA